MIKRHLTALFHRKRCERHVLLPMLGKLTENEQQALWRLLQSVEDDALREGKRKGSFEFAGKF